MKYDVIVIGGGPSGLTAAVYAGRAGKKVLVLERYVCGGQIAFSSEVENYPGFIRISGADFASTLMEQAMNFGAEIEYDEALSVERFEDLDGFKVVTGSSQYECRTVIIATGARCRNIGVEGEDVYKGRGVSYCAVCDGAFYKDRDVVVIGGGNTALEDAIYLSEICKTVYLVHRRDEFRAEPELVNRLNQCNNVIKFMNTVPKAILGTELVESITLTDVVDNTDTTIAVNGVFVAIGRVPDTEFVADILKLNDRGYVDSGEDCTTNIAGIYVAGDCRKRQIKQLTTAVSDGTVAAMAAIDFLRMEL